MLVQIEGCVFDTNNVEFILLDYQDVKYDAVMVQFKSGDRHLWEHGAAKQARLQIDQLLKTQGD